MCPAFVNASHTLVAVSCDVRDCHIVYHYSQQLISYQPPCCREEQPMKGSRASLSSTIKLGESDDEGSLAEYGDIDTGKFNEDGSFLGLYHDKKKGMDSTV